MSIRLYNRVNLGCSRYITRQYSTSFSLGIRLLHKKYRDPVYAIYGFVRFADEIVDSFQHFGPDQLLKEFIHDTWTAIERGISTNPVLHSFQWVVNTYQIDHHLIHAFLHSMKTDLSLRSHNANSYREYIYGSAEVVGLMCLQVFCEGNPEKFKQLEAHARSLGAAFQKVNFLRDLGADFAERGRIYFPHISSGCFNEQTKKQIEAEIKADFQHALEGIRRLPRGCRIGVYLAYRYYHKLFRKIASIPARVVAKKRIRINNIRKISILARAMVRHSMNLI